MNRYDDLAQEFAMYIPHPVTGEKIMQFANREDLGKPETMSEEELQQVEQRLGHSLPEDYREFLRDYGLLIVPSSIPLPNPTDAELGIGLFGVFLGIAPNDQYDLVEMNTGTHILSEMIEIGEGDNGSWYLTITGNNKGNVFFGCHERMYFVAHSFDEFLRLLMQPD